MGKEFTVDWTSDHFAVWSKNTAKLCGQRANILELGSYEGRSAVFWLEKFPDSQLTCIDAYDGWTNEARPADRRLAERRFDCNVASYGSRVTKFKMRSVSGLEMLALQHARFDLIYIDADHSRAGVLVDSLLSWPLLCSGGLLIWDDYAWATTKPPKDRPQQAIDVFLEWHKDEIKLLHKAYQVIVEKR